MLRIGELRHPGPRPFWFVSANITSWGSAAKCITQLGVDLLCLQEAWIQHRDREAAGALARSR
eukprot:4166255-Lingulodinium_polyedra.AAC.1